MVMMFKDSRISKVKYSAVFIAGGMPNYTYVERHERELKEKLETARENLCKLITLTGPTKSGKTVLACKAFPRDKANIWVDGGTIREEDDLWHFILDELDGFTETEIGNSKEKAHDVVGGIEGGVKLPLFHATSKAETRAKRTTTAIRKQKRTISSRAAAIQKLRETRAPLIIDDFHYLSRKLQGDIIRALKPLIFEGHPIILIAIPHRRYDAVKVEREMTGRLEQINVPLWSTEELLKISAKGFRVLNVSVADSVTQKFAEESYGSPHLMQEFCRALAKEAGIVETQESLIHISTFKESLFKSVAQQTGRVIFDKLARGPRQRSDRISRKLKNGGEADIYKVTLLALADLVQSKPIMEKINYEDLRTAIKNLVATDIPQAHEVSRVLEKMAEIAATEESSTPVIDWDKEDRCLHITDPFFAFFLKWGVDPETA